MGQDEVDAVARKDQAADARGGVHADGDGAEAGAQHRGQKAAVAGEDDPPRHDRLAGRKAAAHRSEEHTSELQSLMRISYAVFCLKKKKQTNDSIQTLHSTHSEHHKCGSYTRSPSKRVIETTHN